jgi:hypothetical protein
MIHVPATPAGADAGVPDRLFAPRGAAARA